MSVFSYFTILKQISRLEYVYHLFLIWICKKEIRLIFNEYL